MGFCLIKKGQRPRSLQAPMPKHGHFTGRPAFRTKRALAAEIEALQARTAVPDTVDESSEEEPEGDDHGAVDVLAARQAADDDENDETSSKESEPSELLQLEVEALTAVLTAKKRAADVR